MTMTTGPHPGLPLTPAPPPGGWGAWQVTPGGFGPPLVRKRGKVRILIGVVLVLAGAFALTVGIFGVVHGTSRTRADAVGRSVVGGSPISFQVPAGAERTYTIYAEIGGGGDSDWADTAVSSIRCQAALPNERTASVSGQVQAVSVNVGSLRSVGWFSAPAGATTVTCTSSGAATGAPFLVSPGKPLAGGLAIAEIIGGAFGLAIGFTVLIWGLVGKRVLADT